MTRKTLLPILMAFILVTAFICPYAASADDSGSPAADKALCEKMVRFGKQAYERGKYLDAKEYFRKAVKADPGSVIAWRYYDLAVVFSLAEKVEQNLGKRSDMLTPGESMRQETLPGSPRGHLGTPPPPEKEKEEEPKIKFKIVEDEGC